jgi:peptidoglycan/LPS O-acetylase OafA/YrhL
LAGLVVFVLGSQPFFQTGCILVSAGAILSAAKTVAGPIGLLLNLSWLRYLGTISYGLYMYHNFSAYVAYDLLTFPKLPLGLQLPLFTVITIALAAISWHFFEKPINENKRHFPYDPVPVSTR